MWGEEAERTLVSRDLVLDLVEGEAGAVGWRRVFGVCDGVEVAGGYAGLEDQIPVGFGDAVAVVYYGEGPVASVFQGRGDVDAGGAGVAGVAQELEEGVLHVGDAGGAAAGALHAGQAGEACAEVPVGAFH